MTRGSDVLRCMIKHPCTRLRVLIEMATGLGVRRYVWRHSDGVALATALAGLLTALNGPLLIIEHYTMAEALATCLLASALLVLLRAVRRASRAQLMLAGLTLGLASAAHQRLEVLVLAAPLALLLGG